MSYCQRCSNRGVLLLPVASPMAEIGWTRAAFNCPDCAPPPGWKQPERASAYRDQTVGGITIGASVGRLADHELWGLWHTLVAAVEAGERRQFRYASDIADAYRRPTDRPMRGPEKPQPPQRVFTPKMVADSLGGEIMPQGEDMADDPDLPF